MSNKKKENTVYLLSLILLAVFAVVFVSAMGFLNYRTTAISLEEKVIARVEKDSVSGLETAVSYTTPGTDWTFTVAYAYLHNADRELSKRSYLGSDDRVFKSAWTGEILYNLTSNFQIYGEAERLNTSVTSPEAQNKLSLGLIYNF